MHHEFHLFYLDNIVLHLLTLSIFVADIKSRLSRYSFFEKVCQLFEDGRFSLLGLFFLLKFLLSQVLIAIEKGHFLFVVLGCQLSQGFFLLGEVALTEIGVPILLASLSEGSQHAIGRNDALLD